MREEKRQMVKDLGSVLEPATGVVLINYKGLSVAEFTEVRERLAQINAHCQVVPNRLFRRAATEIGQEELAERVAEGDTAMVTTGDDPIQTVKCINEFVEKYDQVAFKCGLIDGQVCDKEEMAQLAALPSKQALQAQLLTVLNGPAQKLVGVLNNSTASLVYALQAYVDKKQKSES